ncbi:T9SS type A sorting domain-containing protein [Paucihalobacter sp.]|uniref:T9SS type A sorting domain-containing protein n=1 Tax=Paucihalobacter sp. TaxID=2850405 RepID=UPI002FE14A3E
MKTKTKYLLSAFVLTMGFCFTSKAQGSGDIMTIFPGTSVSIASGTTLSAPEVNLKSTSTQYACLLLNGTIGGSTIVNYDRFVNVVGTLAGNGGNDLVSFPVKATGDVTFNDLLNFSPDNGTTTNSDIIVNSPSVTSLFAFGHYNNESASFVNYDSIANSSTVLNRAVGYRTATYSGQTIRFTGTVSKTTETVGITTNTNYWNLVGNPYTTYLDSQMFLAQNASVLDENAVAIYGYNSGTNIGDGTIGNYTIINYLTNSAINIAPGQGFFVANDLGMASNQLTFTTAMRTFSGTDDFILERNTDQNHRLRLKAEHSNANFATEFYFNTQSTLGLDPGYDAALYSGSVSNLMLYSQLVENNLGRNLALQSLGLSDLNDVTIPLGLKTAQGFEVVFSIEDSTLPSEVLVYLEDRQTNTFTLLNDNNYSFTAETAISGTGRFFLRIGNQTLSDIKQENSKVSLYANQQTIFIKGLLLADSTVEVYDIQGRLVLNQKLKEGSDDNSIAATSLNTGIYIIHLKNEIQMQTKKVIIH